MRRGNKNFQRKEGGWNKVGNVERILTVTVDPKRESEDDTREKINISKVSESRWMVVEGLNRKKPDT